MGNSAIDMNDKAFSRMRNKLESKFIWTTICITLADLFYGLFYLYNDEHQIYFIAIPLLIIILAYIVFSIYFIFKYEKNKNKQISLYIAYVGAAHFIVFIVLDFFHIPENANFTLDTVSYILSLLILTMCGTFLWTKKN